MAISKIKVGAKMKDSFRTDIGCSNPFVIDQPEAGGGTNAGPNPLEVFLSSLAGCICAIGRIIATQKNINLKGISVNIEAGIDKNFLLGQTKEGRAGFTEIVVTTDIDADMSKQEKETFLEEIEERCPIADNIANKSVIKNIVI